MNHLIPQLFVIAKTSPTYGKFEFLRFDISIPSFDVLFITFFSLILEDNFSCSKLGGYAQGAMGIRSG